MIATRQNSLTLAALLILLVATLGAAYVDLGAFHTPAAMLVSLAKAVLIVLVFMRLRQTGPLAMLALAAGLFWLLIMFALTLSDYLTRA